MADPKRARSWKRRTQPRIDLTNAEPVLYSTCIRAFDSQLLFNPEEQRPKGIVNIPPMTDKIYFDTGFTVV